MCTFLGNIFVLKIVKKYPRNFDLFVTVNECDLIHARPATEPEGKVLQYQDQMSNQ